MGILGLPLATPLKYDRFQTHLSTLLSVRPKKLPSFFSGKTHRTNSCHLSPLDKGRGAVMRSSQAKTDVFKLT